jgi:hypothetical protein
MSSILVLGAGELGLSVLRGLVSSRETISAPTPIPSLTVLLRPNSRTSETSAFKALGEVSILHGDLVTGSQSDLAELFLPYDIIIGCMGFGSAQGLQLKIAKAVLEAAERDNSNGKVKRYFPWQFGVDYDIIGRGSGQDLFDEQLDVRDLLRTEAERRGVEWVIISTGMFMGFLFEEWFGVVEGWKRGGPHLTIRALGSWENSITLTTVEDIGTLTAKIVLHDPRIRNSVVYVGGDTISFERLVDVVSTATGKAVQKELLTVEDLKKALDTNPGDVLAKYRLVFAKGRGVAWDLEKTFNGQNEIPVQSIDRWVEANL